MTRTCATQSCRPSVAARRPSASSSGSRSSPSAHRCRISTDHTREGWCTHHRRGGWCKGKAVSFYLATDFCVEGAVQLDIGLVALDQVLIIDVRRPVVDLEFVPRPRREARDAPGARGAHLDAPGDALTQPELRVEREGDAVSLEQVRRTLHLVIPLPGMAHVEAHCSIVLTCQPRWAISSRGAASDGSEGLHRIFRASCGGGGAASPSVTAT